MMPPNQFTAPKDLSVYDAYMVRGKHANTMKQLYDFHERSPNLCILHPILSVVWMRHDNKRHKFSPAQILYYLKHGEVHAHCGTPTCGTPKCANPDHQRIAQ